MTFRNGLKSLLRSEESEVDLGDFQLRKLAGLSFDKSQTVANNSTALAKATRTLCVSVVPGIDSVERDGFMFSCAPDLLTSFKALVRTFFKVGRDKCTVGLVEGAVSTPLIMVEQWKEGPLEMPVTLALCEGCAVWVNASSLGAVSVEAFDADTQPRVASGTSAVKVPTLAASQRGWFPAESIGELTRKWRLQMPNPSALVTNY